MDPADLDKLIEESEAKIEKAETDFKAGVEELQKKYQDMMAEKEKIQEEIKNAGLGLMKSCKSHLGSSAGSDEL
jgi:Skp family chaperone for outer membrane proteins